MSMVHSEEEPVHVTLMHVVPPGTCGGSRASAQKTLDRILEGETYEHLHRICVEGTDVVESVLTEAKKHDLIIIGASEEPLFRNLLMGNVAEQIAKQASVSVIIVKRRRTRIHSFLRQTVFGTAGAGESGTV